jgi:hypothetical protein
MRKLLNEFKISNSGNLPESELRDGIPHYRNFKDGTPAPLPASAGKGKDEECQQVAGGPVRWNAGTHVGILN